MKVWNFWVAFVWIKPTSLTKLITCTQLRQFSYQSLPFPDDLQRIFFGIGVFLEQLTQLFGAFLQNASNRRNLCFDLLELLLVSDSSEPRPSFHEFCVLEFIILLIFEEFANFEARQLAADIVLHFDEVQELEALYRLVD